MGKNDGLKDKALKVKMVRVREAFGACRMVGEFVRETESSFIFKKEGETKNKRIGKKTKAKHTGFPNPQPHIEACPLCEENRDPRACIHNRVGFCETCAST